MCLANERVHMHFAKKMPRTGKERGERSKLGWELTGGFAGGFQLLFNNPQPYTWDGGLIGICTLPFPPPTKIPREWLKMPHQSTLPLDKISG